MYICDDEAARSALFEHVQRLEESPGFDQPTEDMWLAYDANKNGIMEIAHKTNRGQKEIAQVLDISVNKFVAMLEGQSVLDVGCGIGVLSRQLTGNKTISVTALDHDPEVLSKITPRPNLRIIEGSGYDLQTALDGEEFDAVIVAYSSLMWARNSTQAEQAIESALQVCKVGGRAFFMPLMQHLGSHEVYEEELAQGRLPGFPEVDQKDLGAMLNTFRAESWMRSRELRHFETAERLGRISCSYVASAINRQRKAIHPILKADHPKYEEYSVVATLLDK